MEPEHKDTNRKHTPGIKGTPASRMPVLDGSSTFSHGDRLSPLTFSFTPVRALGPPQRTPTILTHAQANTPPIMHRTTTAYSQAQAQTSTHGGDRRGPAPGLIEDDTDIDEPKPLAVASVDVDDLCQSFTTKTHVRTPQTEFATSDLLGPARPMHKEVSRLMDEDKPAQSAMYMGSVELLTPVRASKGTKTMLGNSKVLTPVRRSARKVASTPAVDALLESTNFCYTPNAALHAKPLDMDAAVREAADNSKAVGNKKA